MEMDQTVGEERPVLTVRQCTEGRTVRKASSCSVLSGPASDVALPVWDVLLQRMLRWRDTEKALLPAWLTQRDTGQTPSASLHPLGYVRVGALDLLVSGARVRELVPSVGVIQVSPEAGHFRRKFETSVSLGHDLKTKRK